jgi:hydroxymethylglutaryl-CoA synthase
MSAAATTAVGIGDIALYLPSLQIDMGALIRRRIEENPLLRMALKRAFEYTQQKKVRFPAWWEDCATMAAQAALRLLTRGTLSLADLRYLAVGTETTVDHSKPVAAYVEGMLQEAGCAVPEGISTFQIQHACAGGMISLLAVLALLALTNRPAESGVVVCSDIARYDAASTAELTQGAGAVAMSACVDPKLLEIDVATAGYSSSDVDDFFRPLGSDTARVKGGYSLKCYKRAVSQALLDHCARAGREPREVLAGTDAFALHSPFMTLPVEAMSELIGRHLGLDDAASRAFLAERDLDAAVAPVGVIGNIYSGALFLGLASVLWKRYRRLGDDIVGRQVLLCSYGSGNTAAVVAGRVAAGAPEVIRSWTLDEELDHAVPASFRQYDRWMGSPDAAPNTADGAVPDGGAVSEDEVVPAQRFFLRGIREDGYRLYDYQRDPRP